MAKYNNKSNDGKYYEEYIEVEEDGIKKKVSKSDRRCTLIHEIKQQKDGIINSVKNIISNSK